jgi:hypothetical protein
MGEVTWRELHPSLVVVLRMSPLTSLLFLWSKEEQTKQITIIRREKDQAIMSETQTTEQIVRLI